MKRQLAVLAVLTLAALRALAAAPAPQGPPQFDEYFQDKALRVDLYQSGDAKSETLTIHRLVEEPLWPESKAGLIPPFDYGRYVLRIYDAASNRLIFSRGFETMFAEYKTTSPALAGTVRVFERSLRFPEPRRPVLFVIEQRDKRSLLHPVFTQIATDPCPSDEFFLLFCFRSKFRHRQVKRFRKCIQPLINQVKPIYLRPDDFFNFVNYIWYSLA